MVVKKIKKDPKNGDLSETHIERYNDSGTISLIAKSEKNIDYVEIMRQVEAGELTIEEAE